MLTLPTLEPPTETGGRTTPSSVFTPKSAAQPIRDPGNISLDPGAPLRHHFAVLRQQSPQTVDLRGAKLHQLLTHPMQRQQRLLLLALDRHCLDLRLLYRRPDPACI